MTKKNQNFSQTILVILSFTNVSLCFSQFSAVLSQESHHHTLTFSHDPFSSLVFYQFCGGLFFSPLTALHLALLLLSTFLFSTPFLLTSLKFWATLRRACWHRLVVDDFFAVITHMHARTCWSGPRVDEQCQPRSGFGGAAQGSALGLPAAA